MPTRQHMLFPRVHVADRAVQPLYLISPVAGEPPPAHPLPMPPKPVHFAAAGRQPALIGQLLPIELLEKCMRTQSHTG